MGDSVKIKEIPESLRPREKALNEGLESLSDRELIALFIRKGTKDNSALIIADEVLKMIDDISGLNRISREELMEIKGIHEIKAIELLALPEIAKRMSKPKHKSMVQIDQPYALVSWLNLEIGYKKQEYFIAVFLDKQNRLLGHSILFKGTLDRSVVHPREIFKDAVIMSAAAIILVHNHPGGGLAPSTADLETTELLVNAGKLMGVHILDHLIVSEGSYVSMREDFSFIFEY